MRERSHALMLDRCLGLDGRSAEFPDHTAPVEWASGCAWLLRGEAVRSVGPLDEAYFMYFEDVDYCRRLRDAGWVVLATPDARVIHAHGRGSTDTPSVSAVTDASTLSEPWPISAVPQYTVTPPPRSIFTVAPEWGISFQ